MKHKKYNTEKRIFERRFGKDYKLMMEYIHCCMFDLWKELAEMLKDNKKYNKIKKITGNKKNRLWFYCWYPFTIPDNIYEYVRGYEKRIRKRKKN